jgi:hypothetical protein
MQTAAVVLGLIILSPMLVFALYEMRPALIRLYREWWA